MKLSDLCLEEQAYSLYLDDVLDRTLEQGATDENFPEEKYVTGQWQKFRPAWIADFKEQRRVAMEKRTHIRRRDRQYKTNLSGHGRRTGSSRNQSEQTQKNSSQGTPREYPLRGASRDDGYDARSRNPTGPRNAAFFDFGEMNSRRQESSRPPEDQESGQTQPNEWDAYSRHGPGYGAPSGRTGGSDVPSSSIVGRCDAANVTLGYTDVYFLCDWCDDGSRRRLKGVSRMRSWHEQSVKTL